MVKKYPFPNGIDRGLAAEINFIISKFRELPEQERRTLATAILEEDPSGKPYAEAGCKIFQLILDADDDELSKFINEQHYGEGQRVFDGYYIEGHFGTKAGIMTAYFRDHLTLNDNTCDVPMLNVQPKLAA